MQSAARPSSSPFTATGNGALHLSSEPRQPKKSNNEKTSICSHHHQSSVSSTVTNGQQSLGELESFLHFSNMCIFGVDLDRKINLWNQQMSMVSGFSKDSVLNQPLVSASFFSPGQQKQIGNALERALSKGEATSNCKLAMMMKPSSDETKSSDVRYLLVNVSARKSNSNNGKSTVGAICMAQVLSEPVVSVPRQYDAFQMSGIDDHDEGATNGSHHNRDAVASFQMKQLLDRANTLFFAIDKQGKITEWNQKMVEITEFSREEAIQQPFVSTFVLPTLQGSVDHLMQKALQGEETSNYEIEFRTKSNNILCLFLSTTTHRAAGKDAISGVMVFSQDVTEMALHDRASMSRELRQLVETANAPIFGIDVHGNVNEWNNKTAEITGFSKAEALHQPLVSTFISPSLRQSVQEVLDDALRGNETSNYQLEFRTKTDDTRYLLVNASSRRNIKGNIVGVVGVAQDVTDDHKHSEELRQMQNIRAAQEAKLETERNMTAYFAHELRNPLHSIDSALKLMPDLPLTAESTELVRSMTQCASFMSSIMNNLLDVRKMEEGKMVLNKIPLSLAGLLERVRTMLLPSVRSGVTFLTHCNLRDKDWVLGDSHRIQQVLTNVITNAIKYTTRGSIVVTVSVKNDLIRFECTDTGTGIPVQDQNKLFQRFVQRGGAPGTGLGLTIAKHLVDLTGGQIFFESDPSSQPGTTCVIEMPLQCCPEPTIREEKPESAFLEAPIRLLIVDDIRMNRTMFRRRVIKGIASKAKITEASTGEQALDICKHQGFDVIMMDQHMEDAGGVLLGTDTVVALRRRMIDSVIVGCSGNDIGDEFMESGTDWVMKKPTPPNDVIVSRLRQLLARRQRRLDESIENNCLANFVANNNNNITTPASAALSNFECMAGVLAAPSAAPVASSSAAPYVTDFSTSEAVKRRLGLSVCPGYGPALPHFKNKQQNIV